MSSWLCSSGSRPWAYLELQKPKGRLPDEHNQLDRLYVETLLILKTVFCILGMYGLPVPPDNLKFGGTSHFQSGEYIQLKFKFQQFHSSNKSQEM